MKISKLRNKLKKSYFVLKESQSNLSQRNKWFSKWIENLRLGLTKPQVFAYQLMGGRMVKFLPLFRDLDGSLKKSGMKFNFKAYVSTIIIASLIMGISTFILVPLFLYFIFELSIFQSLVFGIGISLFVGATTVIVFYIYPSIRADNVKRDLEDGLPFTAGYMSILAGAGVPPDFIWRSLANVDISFSVSNLAKNVVRDVELFGFDAITALETASKRTPSEKLKELLEGFISVVHSGGNLSKYLRNRSLEYMKLKQLALKRFSDNLGVLAEFYVTFMVAGSLIFVVMLAVMAMLGGGGLGSLDSRLLLQLLTYVGLPIGSTIFLIILEMISPRK